MTTLTFPELRQTFEYDCGANALQSVFAYYGIDIREEILLKKLKTTKKNGTKIDNMESVATDYGFKVDIKEMNVEILKDYIKKKIPVIVLLQAWSNKKVNYKKNTENGHYVVAIGYDKNNFYFEDPYSVLRTYLSFNELSDRWHDKQKKGNIVKHIGIAIHGKRPNYNPKKAIIMP